MTPPGAKKIFISRDGKIIGHQIGTAAVGSPAGKVAIAPTPPTVTRITAAAAPASNTNQLAAAASSPGSSQPAGQQKVQIVKTADGKIQVSSSQQGFFFITPVLSCGCPLSCQHFRLNPGGQCCGSRSEVFRIRWIRMFFFWPSGSRSVIFLHGFGFGSRSWSYLL
jgi:pimeloyl-ACP methyl ester carboxylesterase